MAVNLGKRLERARKASGIGLRKLADLVGLSHMAISKFEKGMLDSFFGYSYKTS